MSVESTELVERIAEEPPGVRPVFVTVINSIDGLNWESLDTYEMMRIAKVYYYFSVQIRENLEIACALYPADRKLQELRDGECRTDNLSPWPGIANAGEKMNHDEFMRRLIWLHPTIAVDEGLTQAGTKYLRHIRTLDASDRAASLASYEDGGLATVFMAMLRAKKAWDDAGNRAFRHFLVSHLRFDGDHGALSRHLAVDDRILPLWLAFRDLLSYAVPKLIE